MVSAIRRPPSSLMAPQAVSLSTRAVADARDDVPYALAGETRLQLVALGDEVFIWDSAIRIARELRL